MGDIETYSTVMLDPNWQYQQFGQKKHGGARSHYKLATWEEITQFPLHRYLRKDSNVLLWVPIPKLMEGLRVIDAWKLTQVTGIVWVKTTPNKATLAKGIGHWGYSTSEILLVCRQGNPGSPKYKSGIEKPDLLLTGDVNDESVFYSRKGPHSRKPPSLIEWVESYLPGPYAEFFARDTRVGWDTFGFEVGTHLGPEGITRYVDAVASGEVEPKPDDPAELRRKLWTPTPPIPDQEQ